ncbi:MAG: hypothetical protein R2720_00740 [Candidatus Nanopelagicales bacterium]
MSKHPIDVLSLGAGVMFSLFALAYMLVPDRMDWAVTVPLMLVGLGVFGMAAAIVSQRRRRSELPAGH